jgi:hypothetical protein
MLNRRSLLLAGLTVALGPIAAPAGDPPAPTGPAYQIVLRSRSAEATPNRTRDAQTGGGAVVVEQPEPHTIVVKITGAAVAGSECHGSSHAGIDFDLEQDFDIIPVRKGVRPPRVGMVGRVVGTLQVTDPGKCGKACGTADQGPATACLVSGGASILDLVVKPSSIACGSEVSVNHRTGPVEAPAAVGSYCLKASFRIGVTQGKGVFHRQFAVADFDPAPQLDGTWADALRPFRAVPRRDFGYQLILRVVEEAAPVAVEPKP